MTDSYCSTDDVAAAVGIVLGASPDATLLDRISTAALLGTAYVDMRVTGTVPTTALTPPYTVTRVACPAAYRAAAIVAAVRYLSAKDIPFGAVSVGEYGKVLGNIPEADLILRGYRAKWGLA